MDDKTCVWTFINESYIALLYTCILSASSTIHLSQLFQFWTWLLRVKGLKVKNGIFFLKLKFTLLTKFHLWKIWRNIIGEEFHAAVKFLNNFWHIHVFTKTCFQYKVHEDFLSYVYFSLRSSRFLSESLMPTHASRTLGKETTATCTCMQATCIFLKYDYQKW